MPVTRAIPSARDWVDFMRQTLEHERVEMEVTDYAVKSVASREDMVREFGDSYHTDTNTILFGGRLLSAALFM